jgi:hypothetical protein
MIGWLLLLLTKERRAYRKYSSLSLGNLVMKVLQLALQMMSEGFWYGKTVMESLLFMTFNVLFLVKKVLFIVIAQSV